MGAHHRIERRGSVRGCDQCRVVRRGAREQAPFALSERLSAEKIFRCLRVKPLGRTGRDRANSLAAPHNLPVQKHANGFPGRSRHGHWEGDEAGRSGKKKNFRRKWPEWEKESIPHLPPVGGEGWAGPYETRRPGAGFLPAFDRFWCARASPGENHSDCVLTKATIRAFLLSSFLLGFRIRRRYRGYNLDQKTGCPEYCRFFEI